MKVELLVDRREQIAEGAFIELALWRVPKPVPPATHRFKYRLAYVVNGVCVVRYDNERGKGDHKHYAGAESLLTFSGPEQLLSDFKADVARWNHENRNS